ncbi:alpha/beta fold hydrolase [Chitinophaga japonensis]|uniref:Pimeloyl-ACP methyl ester carboxylesterase n=1 Tax=Chitinophaga japonensis TaxID=104662 RepID=A0A562TGL9_CHIJA|nr:alpha/beta hydrolase [Chitinophaga japonensis]TWI92186.1 pimeloyl-ACP methyl ester carboxylesterase [Chitinophaga japonensis]
MTIPVNGVPIFARHAGQSRKAIIFIHGGLQSSAVWDQQLNDELLLEQFSLVALDLPGHGRSGRSAEPEKDYSLQGMARQLAACINDMSWEQYLLVGLSSGTNLVSEALPLLSVPPKGLFFAGASIAGRQIPLHALLLSSPYKQVLAATPPSEAALTAYSKSLVYQASDQFIAGFKQYYYDTDPGFRTVFGQYLEDGHPGEHDHIDGIVQSQLPVGFVMGQQETVIRSNYLDGIPFQRKWKDTVFKVPAAGHLVNCDQPQIFNHLLLQFADEILNKK